MNTVDTARVHLGTLGALAPYLDDDQRRIVAVNAAMLTEAAASGKQLSSGAMRRHLLELGAERSIPKDADLLALVSETVEQAAEELLGATVSHCSAAAEWWKTNIDDPTAAMRGAAARKSLPYGEHKSMGVDMERASRSDRGLAARPERDLTEAKWAAPLREGGEPPNPSWMAELLIELAYFADSADHPHGGLPFDRLAARVTLPQGMTVEVAVDQARSELAQINPEWSQANIEEPLARRPFRLAESLNAQTNNGATWQAMQDQARAYAGDRLEHSDPAQIHMRVVTLLQDMEIGRNRALDQIGEACTTLEGYAGTASATQAEYRIAVLRSAVAFVEDFLSGLPSTASAPADGHRDGAQLSQAMVRRDVELLARIDKMHSDRDAAGLIDTVLGTSRPGATLPPAVQGVVTKAQFAADVAEEIAAMVTSRLN